MANYVLGMNAGLYFGTAGENDPASMTVIGNCSDVTLNMSTQEATITTRGNSGWEAIAATLRSCTIDFKMIWKPADAAFTAIKTAFLSAGLVAIACLDQLYTITGSQGPVGDFVVTNFSRNEPLAEAITADVTLKLSAYDSWFTAS